MLRGVVIAVGVLCLAGSAFGVAGGAGPAMIGPAIIGVLLVVGTVFERRIYRRPNAAPPGGADWELTGERFRDDAATGAIEVWFNKVTGDRRYVKIRIN